MIFLVRELRAVGDGSEMRATLTGSDRWPARPIREQILLAVLAAVRPHAESLGATRTARPRWPSAGSNARRWRCSPSPSHHRTCQRPCHPRTDRSRRGAGPPSRPPSRKPGRPASHRRPSALMADGNGGLAARHPGTGMRVGGGGRRRGGRGASGALSHHVPDAGQ